MNEQNETATFEDALESTNEVPLEEVADIEHLAENYRALLLVMIIKAENGLEPLPDDPTVRAMVNGAVLKKLKQSTDEPGYAEPGNEEKTSELSEYVNELTDAQYEGSLDTLKTFGLYNPEQPKKGDVPAPTLEQAKEILADQVTPEQLEVIKRMEKPTLQLIPVTSMDRYAEALDSHKPMDGQKNAYVSPWHRRGAFKRADERDGVIGDTIIGWKIAVTEGVKEPKLLEGDDVNKTLRERAAWLTQEFGRKGVSGVDLKRMLALMMDSLKAGEPVNDYWKDDGTWTFVNEEGEKNGNVSGVFWYDDFRPVTLREYGADYQYGYARFRASVMVDVPKS